MSDGGMDEAGVPGDMVACPTCEGTGRQLPPTPNARPCVVCAGSGLVRADVAESIAESEVMEVEPKGEG